MLSTFLASPRVVSPVCVPLTPRRSPYATPNQLAVRTFFPRFKTTFRAAMQNAVEDLPMPLLDNAMFCYQCEQTAKGTGCTTVGVCGKTPEVTFLQDLLTYTIKGLCSWAAWAKSQGVPMPPGFTSYLHAATFSTLTNVNFDPARFKDYLQTGQQFKTQIQESLRAAGINEPPPLGTKGDGEKAAAFFGPLVHPSRWEVAPDFFATSSDDALQALGGLASLEHRRHLIDRTVLGLQEMLVYGLRGMCAYAHHADVLGQHAPEADDFVVEAYSFLCTPQAGDVDSLLSMILQCGQANLGAMRALDEGHTGRFGHPVPSPVRLTPVKGKAILISGHDMGDLYDLLKSTEGTGINVYTHGEMLPAHGYPELKKFPHLVGNYGGAWYRQQKEFAEFPGAILMTTNCIIEPRSTYSDRLFTTGEVGWPGVGYIPYGETPEVGKDYSGLIARAQELPGFVHEPEEPRFVTTGFARNAVLSVADKVVDAVKQGHLKHIFVVGGCDGSEPDRKYFGKVADAIPQDTMLLSLGCGKFRFYDHDFGMLAGTELPRYLDMGQCNDAYSAIAVASALAKEMNTDINSLPLSLDLSWLEQKAVAVLLTLLSLGVKNVRIGPKPPAFLTPEALAVVVDKFDLKVTDVKNPEADVQAMLAGA